MGFWSEYDPRSGVVFDDIDDAINAALGGTSGAAAPPKPGPAPNTERPAGTEVSPGRIVSPNLLTTYMYNPTTGWAPSPYPPSADDKRAAGGGTATSTRTGGGTTTYAASNLADRTNTLANAPGIAQKEALIAQGGRSLGGNLMILPNGDRYSLRNDGTGLYGAYGRATATEMRQVGAQMMAERAQGTPGTTPNPATTAAANPFAVPLEARNGSMIPTIGGQNANDFRLTGPVSSEGRQTIRSNDLNTLFTGRQGSAVQIPVTPGFRQEGQYGNSIAFASGSSGNGRAEPQMLFGPTIASVPDTYVQGQGNVNDANRAYSTYANIGPGGAVPINIGGNNVQLSNADKSVGYGFALNAMPSSNVFAAASRGSPDDPALQAVAALQLQAAINQYGMGAVTAANPSQYGGNHAGTFNGPWSGNGGMAQGMFFAGYDPDKEARDAMGGIGDIYGGGFGVDGGQRGFAGGGRIAVLPLGGPVTSGPKQMITSGPKVLVDVRTGRVDAIMGEDNADRDRLPDRERLTFSGPNNSRLKITPLDPPRRYAEGGEITNEESAAEDRMGAIAAMLAYAAEEARNMADQPQVYGPPTGGLLGNFSPFENYQELPYYQPNGSFDPNNPGVYPGQPVMGSGMPQVPSNTYDTYGLPQRGYSDYQAFAVGGRILNTPFSSDLYEGESYGPPPPPFVPPPPPTPIPPPQGEGEGYGGGASAPPQGEGFGPPPGALPPPTGAPPPPFELPPPPNPFVPPPTGAPPPVVDPGAPPPPVEIPIDPGVSPTINFNANDPSILAPWQQAAQELARRDGTRNAYAYRSKFAGLQGPVAVPVIQGDVPADELPPGMYYDPSGQVNRMISNIQGAQEALTAAGEPGDITPVYAEVGTLGQNLDDQQRIRDLTIQRTGVAASGNAAAQAAAQAAAAASQEAQNAYALMQQTQTLLTAALAIAGGNARDPNVVEVQNALNAAGGAYSSANARAQALANQAAQASGGSPDERLAAIDAQLAELQGRLPQGFTEAGARTRLAELQQQVNLNNKRIQLKTEVQNLAKIGVPKLNGPIIPVRPAA